MNLKKMAAVVAATTLTVAPVSAQAVDSVAPAVERVSGSAENLEGENGIVIALLAAAAVIAGIIIIADDGNPTSP